MNTIKVGDWVTVVGATVLLSSGEAERIIGKTGCISAIEDRAARVVFDDCEWWIDYPNLLKVDGNIEQEFEQLLTM